MIRFRPDELAIISERARACGAPFAKYVRDVALGVTPRARRTQASADLIRQLVGIGNNLNQLVRVAHETGEVGAEGRFRTILEEVLATIRRVE